MSFAVSGTQQLRNKENTVKKNRQSWAVLKRSERIAGFQTKALCLMCVSYFMTLDNCFHLSVASVLTSIAVRFALGRCWYLTDGLFKMWYGFISSEAWAPNTASWGLTRCVPISVWPGPNQWLFLHDGENIELLIFVVFDFSDDYNPLISSLLTCLHLSL